MGVPSFYRWLINKYPDIRMKAINDPDRLNTTTTNPNGIEFDNLYLDMNGIIHPCFHPEDQSLEPPPITYEDVFRSIYEYIDNIFTIVRPRKLLYMAIDGVAPRAKINQQRSRRFRTAKNDEIAEAEEDRLRIQFEMEGKQVLPKVECEVNDSNVITPGTEFMNILSMKLQEYIQSRMNNDPGWKGLQVILSDANVPGEGEHKIMSFIRYQRSHPSYNCNTRHCLYGLDADLIMLALTTHEIHFSILREDLIIQEKQPVFRSDSRTSSQAVESHLMKSRGWFKDVRELSHTSTTHAPIAKRPYEFLHVWILREYIELEMKIIDVPRDFGFDLERIIDDFIFMCFFVGNDFLPHMPSLSIYEGAIDLLMGVYKQHFKAIGGYLVDMQRATDKKGVYVKLKRVEKFILLVGTYEEKIFKKRSELHERSLRRLCQTSDLQEYENEIENLDLPMNSCKISSTEDEILRNTKDLKEKLKENLRKKSDLAKNGVVKDQVRLGVPGWKERYYKHKFSAETKQEVEFMRKDIVQKYTEGLLWVLLYYFSGVPSWSWYYPYYYAPFASDFKGISQVNVKFEKGRPIKPFHQLLSVLPPRSAHALPKPYANLITDTNSKIIDFYPTDFEIDTDGKKFEWQGICKLPFIDEERLLEHTRGVEIQLMAEELGRNTEKVDRLYVSSIIGSKVLALFRTLSDDDKLHMDAGVISGGVSGHVRLSNYDHLKTAPNILWLWFEIPDGILNIPRPLEGVEYPTKSITAADIQNKVLWHEYNGSRPPYNGNGAFTGRRGGSNLSIAQGIVDIKVSDSSHRYGRWSASSRENVNHTWRKSSQAAWGAAGRGGGSDSSSPENVNQAWRKSSQAVSFRPSSANASRQNMHNNTWRSS